MHHIRLNGACKRPQPKLIQIGNHTSKTYYPHCTLLHRCSDETGCCESDSETCRPSSIEMIDQYVFVRTHFGSFFIAKYNTLEMYQLTTDHHDIRSVFVYFFENRFKHSDEIIDSPLNWLHSKITLTAIVYWNHWYQLFECHEVFQRRPQLQHFLPKRGVDARIISWKSLNLERCAVVIAHILKLKMPDTFVRSWRMEKDTFLLKNGSKWMAPFGNLDPECLNANVCH